MSIREQSSQNFHVKISVEIRNPLSVIEIER
jgi:hypothetical protein